MKRLLAYALILLLSLPLHAAAAPVGALTIGVPTSPAKPDHPLFASPTQNTELMSLTQLSLLTLDRAGGVVLRAIPGETRAFGDAQYTYHGPADIQISHDKKTDQTTYTITLSPALAFSDGRRVTSDDVLFSWYVALDPTYDGASDMRSVDILGLREYRTQTTDEIYDRMSDLARRIHAAGLSHKWKKSDDWSQLQQLGYWTIEREHWMSHIRSIVDYCMMYYLTVSEQYTGFTAESLQADPSLHPAFAMAMWGYGARTETGFTAPDIKANWTLKDGDVPTLDDFYRASYALHAGNGNAFVLADALNRAAPGVTDAAVERFATLYGRAETEGGVPSVSGIRRIDRRTLSITTNGYRASDLNALLGGFIAPLHVYGDVALFDPGNGLFGFRFGMLGSVKMAGSMLTGAGPYRLTGQTGDSLTLEANPYYYKGAPHIGTLRLVATDPAAVVAALTAGRIDIGHPPASAATLSALHAHLSGLAMRLIDFPGYGYIGINAGTVRVSDEADSPASKHLRAALATIIAVYRDESVQNYYGEAATLVNYPIPSDSWASPQHEDEDYRIAFSTDLKGAQIYDDEADVDTWYQAALEAAKGLLSAAGYKLDKATGRFTAAPRGAKLEYTVIVNGDGVGDHPMMAALEHAASALDSIGITLTIRDVADADELWAAQQAGTHELWCAAWSVGADPDRYGTWHSSNMPGEGGTDANLYGLDDPELDVWLTEARRETDPEKRKALTRDILNRVLDWAVELPTYQRMELMLFAKDRVDTDTLPEDMTATVGWLSAIEKLRLSA